MKYQCMQFNARESIYASSHIYNSLARPVTYLHQNRNAARIPLVQRVAPISHAAIAQINLVHGSPN